MVVARTGVAPEEGETAVAEHTVPPTVTGGVRPQGPVVAIPPTVVEYLNQSHRRPGVKEDPETAGEQSVESTEGTWESGTRPSFNPGSPPGGRECRSRDRPDSPLSRSPGGAARENHLTALHKYKQ